MLVLTRDDLEKVLTPADVVDALADAFMRYGEGRTLVPPRMVVPVTDDGILFAMPAGMPESLGTKLITFYAGNRERGCPTIHGLYTLADRSTGKPLAVLEGTYITAMRTGATSALAARFMAREDSRRVTCFGAGVQALL